MVKYFMGIRARAPAGLTLWALTMAQRTVTNFESRRVRCFGDDLFPRSSVHNPNLLMSNATNPLIIHRAALKISGFFGGPGFNPAETKAS
jgi:hypothetical protein